MNWFKHRLNIGDRSVSHESLEVVSIEIPHIVKATFRSSNDFDCGGNDVITPSVLPPIRIRSSVQHSKIIFPLQRSTNSHERPVAYKPQLPKNICEFIVENHKIKKTKTSDNFKDSHGLINGSFKMKFDNELIAESEIAVNQTQDNQTHVAISPNSSIGKESNFKTSQLNDTHQTECQRDSKKDEQQNQHPNSSKNDILKMFKFKSNKKVENTPKPSNEASQKVSIKSEQKQKVVKVKVPKIRIPKVTNKRNAENLFPQQSIRNSRAVVPDQDQEQSIPLENTNQTGDYPSVVEKPQKNIYKKRNQNQRTDMDKTNSLNSSQKIVSIQQNDENCENPVPVPSKRELTLPVPKKRNILNLSATEFESESDLQQLSTAVATTTTTTTETTTNIIVATSDSDDDNDSWNLIARHRQNTLAMAQAQMVAKRHRADANQQQNDTNPEDTIDASKTKNVAKSIQVPKPRTMREMRQKAGQNLKNDIDKDEHDC